MEVGDEATVVSFLNVCVVEVVEFFCAFPYPANVFGFCKRYKISMQRFGTNT